MQEPVEAAVYAKLHETRDSFIDDRRRARDYQAQLAEKLEEGYWTPFLIGVMAGIVGTVCGVVVALVLMVGG